MVLARRLGFADIWDDAVSNLQRLVYPAIAGIGVGLLFFVADLLFSQLHEFGALPHPGFPLSLIASATAGIGEEIIFRLFFITFWVWLISWVLLRKRYQETIFWIVAVWSALVFSAGHIPSAMVILGFQTVEEIPTPMLVEMFLLNSVLSLSAAWMLRKWGFLAAVGIHFWADVVWHVVYGAIV